MRAWRLARLVLHLLRGLATVLFLLPRWKTRRRNAAIRRWSRGLLALLAVRIRCHPRPPRLPGGCLVVLNHVSWLDIFLLDAVQPSLFVAKSDIRGWPVLGTFVTGAGTIYLEKGPSGARRANQRVRSALAEGARVACFPEGMTTEGDRVGRFHAALLQPALDAGAWIQPAMLRYCDSTGARTEAAAYVGDDSLLDSLRAILAMKSMTAELRFLPAIPPGRHSDRRGLAEALRAAIARQLEEPR